MEVVDFGQPPVPASDAVTSLSQQERPPGDGNSVKASSSLSSSPAAKEKAELSLSKAGKSPKVFESGQQSQSKLNSKSRTCPTMEAKASLIVQKRPEPIKVYKNCNVNSNNGIPRLFGQTDGSRNLSVTWIGPQNRGNSSATDLVPKIVPTPAHPIPIAKNLNLPKPDTGTAAIPLKTKINGHVPGQMAFMSSPGSPQIFQMIPRGSLAFPLGQQQPVNSGKKAGSNGQPFEFLKFGTLVQQMCLDDKGSQGQSQVKEVSKINIGNGNMVFTGSSSNITVGNENIQKYALLSPPGTVIKRVTNIQGQGQGQTMNATAIVVGNKNMKIKSAATLMPKKVMYFQKIKPADSVTLGQEQTKEVFKNAKPSKFNNLAKNSSAAATKWKKIQMKPKPEMAQIEKGEGFVKIFLNGVGYSFPNSKSQPVAVATHPIHEVPKVASSTSAFSISPPPPVTGMAGFQELKVTPILQGNNEKSSTKTTSEFVFKIPATPPVTPERQVKKRKQKIENIEIKRESQPGAIITWNSQNKELPNSQFLAQASKLKVENGEKSTKIKRETLNKEEKPKRSYTKRVKLELLPDSNFKKIKESPPLIKQKTEEGQPKRIYNKKAKLELPNGSPVVIKQEIVQEGEASNVALEQNGIAVQPQPKPKRKYTPRRPRILQTPNQTKEQIQPSPSPPLLLLPPLPQALWDESPLTPEPWMPKTKLKPFMLPMSAELMGSPLPIMTNANNLAPTQASEKDNTNSMDIMWTQGHPLDEDTAKILALFREQSKMLEQPPKCFGNDRLFRAPFFVADYYTEENSIEWLLNMPSEPKSSVELLMAYLSTVTAAAAKRRAILAAGEPPARITLQLEELKQYCGRLVENWWAQQLERRGMSVDVDQVIIYTR